MLLFITLLLRPKKNKSKKIYAVLNTYLSGEMVVNQLVSGFGIAVVFLYRFVGLDEMTFAFIFLFS